MIYSLCSTSRPASIIHPYTLVSCPVLDIIILVYIRTRDLFSARVKLSTSGICQFGKMEVLARPQQRNRRISRRQHQSPRQNAASASITLRRRISILLPINMRVHLRYLDNKLAHSCRISTGIVKTASALVTSAIQHELSSKQRSLSQHRRGPDNIDRFQMDRYCCEMCQDLSRRRLQILLSHNMQQGEFQTQGISCLERFSHLNRTKTSRESRNEEKRSKHTRRCDEAEYLDMITRHQPNLNI